MSYGVQLQILIFQKESGVQGTPLSFERLGFIELSVGLHSDFHFPMKESLSFQVDPPSVVE